MAALPVEGQANWGRTLNEFLLVSHHADGTLGNVREVINVRDFGAKGDGNENNNDAPKIQAAVDVALAGNIRTVYIPAGEYILAPYGENNSSEPRIWIHGSNLRLMGDGDASHLRVAGQKADGHAYNAITVSPEGILATNSSIQNIEICNLRLSSDDSAHYLGDVYSVGLITALYPPQPPPPPDQKRIGDVENLSIHDCTLETESLVGFTTDVNASQLRFYNNKIKKTGSHGIYMAGFSTDIWIQNNIFAGASLSADHTATGIALKNVTNLYLTGNVIAGYNYCAINPADAPNERLFIVGNTIRDMNYIKITPDISAIAEGIVINWAKKVLISNNIFEHIKHSGIYAVAVNPVSELRIIANEFNNISNEVDNDHSGRAISVEKFHNPNLPNEDRRPLNVTITNNWCDECRQGIATDGVTGLLKLSGNQIYKAATDNKPGLYVLDANSDTMVDHNIVRGYSTSIDVKAMQSNNIVNGVFQEVGASILKTEGIKVVGAQAPAITNADGTLASVTAQLNEALVRLREHGLIAS